MFFSKITKFKEGVYSIRGAKIPPGIIESISIKRKPKKVLQDYGWTNDGHIWIAFKLSEGLINTGICSIPSAMTNYIKGTFTLKATDETIIGHLTVKDNNAWGLRKLFERRGGELDDHLVLNFDPHGHTVKAYISSVDLIEDFISFESNNEENLPGV
jgi:hypothetical protein